MIFKKLFLFIAIVTSLQAQPTVKVEYVYGGEIGLSSSQADRAWIGIYPVGATNAFENVILWEWVKSDKVTIQKIAELSAGDYEARLFFNNSFILEAQDTFSIRENPGNGRKIVNDVNALENTQLIVISLEDIGTDIDKDWIGIFEEDASHELTNLLAWGYRENANSTSVTLKIQNNKTFKLGQYDIVYFKHDTYQQEGVKATLTVIPNFSAKFTQGIEGTSNHVLDAPTYINNIKQENDWIAIFKKNDEPIKKNIIAWSYIHDGVPAKGREEIDYLLEFPSMTHIYPYEESENYKVIIFEKDTYTIVKTINNPY